MKTGYVKYSVVLQNRSQYKFNVVDDPVNDENVIMQLYFNDKLLISNFEKGKFYKSFQFICGKKPELQIWVILQYPVGGPPEGDCSKVGRVLSSWWKTKFLLGKGRNWRTLLFYLNLEN